MDFTNVHEAFQKLHCFSTHIRLKTLETPKCKPMQFYEVRIALFHKYRSQRGLTVGLKSRHGISSRYQKGLAKTSPDCKSMATCHHKVQKSTKLCTCTVLPCITIMQRTSKNISTKGHKVPRTFPVTSVWSEGPARV